MLPTDDGPDTEVPFEFVDRCFEIGNDVHEMIDYWHGAILARRPPSLPTRIVRTGISSFGS